MSYFSIFARTNLPAPAGSYSVATLKANQAFFRHVELHLRIRRAYVLPRGKADVDQVAGGDRQLLDTPHDVVGRLFHEFAVTLAIAIVLSAVISLTLVPMMCALMVRHRADRGRNRYDLAAERGFNWVIKEYDCGLTWVLNHQALTLFVFVATLAVSCAQYAEIPKGFFPVQDTGAIQAITTAAQDISFSAMARKQQALADVILHDHDVAGLSSFIGVDGTNMALNNGRFLILLKPHDERQANVSEVIRRLEQETASVAGISVAMQPVQDLTIDSTVGRAQYLFFLQNPKRTEFAIWIPRLVQRMQHSPLFEDVSSDLAEQGRQLLITIDRPTAARFGITPATVDNALYDAFGQRIASTYYTQSNQYRVILKANIHNLRDLSDAIAGIYLPSATAATGQVPLAAIVRLSQKNSPLQMENLAQLPSISISFNLAKGASMESAFAEIKQAETDIGLPPSFSTVYQGALSAFQKSLSNELMLILAAVAAVYIVLGVLYESFLHPITILSTLPSAGVGALLALRLVGADLDVIGIIGIILLIGIVKKNAIMMIDFALEAERVEGKSPREAIHQACLLRFRPILMTTMAALLGALPLMLGAGTGSELRQPLGLCIVGGLLVSQLLTLFTTPVVYLAIDRVGSRWFPHRFNQQSSEGSAA
jgi:multidrug efflux pump